MTKSKKIKKVSKFKQNLAFRLVNDAMGTLDINKVLRLCREAVELDPYCIEAHAILSFGVDDVDQRVEYIRNVVKIAEEFIGGKDAINDKKFIWNNEKMRPYMFAREFLIKSLKIANRLDEAITECNELLELNPFDDQGIRFSLIGLYLDVNDIKNIQRLLNLYDTNDAIYAWAYVYERFV